MSRAGRIDCMIGERVEKARSLNRLSKSEMGRRLDVSPQAYTKLENGDTAFTVSTLLRVAEALDMDYRDLIPPREAWQI